MISAKVIADSIYNSKRITSIQLRMPRFILAQFNTHRMFSRSTASSRAIPTAKLIDMVRTEYVQPIHWGKNQAGMQASEELHPKKLELAKELWFRAAQNASDSAEQLLAIGVHKQVVNRILEPFMWAETIVTATEWDNFFNLRLDEASQPEIQELARCMKEALDNSKPVNTAYHLPYIKDNEIVEYMSKLGGGVSQDDVYRYFAKISAARCARVSYLNHDQSEPDVVKDLELYTKLRDGGHWSPMEHQATAILYPEAQVDDFRYYEDTDEFGDTSISLISSNRVRCRNFIGWEQFRAEND